MSPRAERVVRRGRLALLAVLSTACSPAEGREVPLELVELERLSFVPARAAYLDGYIGQLANVSIEEPLLVDLFELTRADRDLHLARVPGAEPDRSTAAWPAAVTWYEAREIAERRGMRLPTAREWLHVAVGGRSQVFPWGNRFQVSVSNTLELDLRRPTAVGTFENGRSRPFGCYDMVGNVWEWVADRVPGYQDPSGTSWEWVADREPGFPDASRSSAKVLEGDELATILGGGFDTRARRTFGSNDGASPALRFLARTVDRRLRAPAIGVRMVADAAPYLRRFAPRWGRGTEARSRVTAVARRWTAAVGQGPVLELLDQLLSEPDAPRQLAWLREGVSARP